MTAKRTAKLIMIITVFSAGVFLAPLKSQAAVPVVVFGEYLNQIKTVSDISDTDPEADLQSKIIGEREYTEGDPYNATVTHTQKMQGSPDDKEIVLDSLLDNINERIVELERAIAEEENKEDSNKALIDTMEESVGELTALRARINSLKSQLAESVALDVHIVKDTSDTLDDLKALAREKLARTQVSELSRAFNNQYEETIIRNFHDYMYQEPVQSAYNYLDNVHFKADETVMSEEKKEAMSVAVKRSLVSSYSDPALPEKDPEFVGIENIFKKEEGGGWDQWRLALKPNNNDYGIFFSAKKAAQELAESKKEEQITKTLAYQGIKPITGENEKGELGPGGNSKEEIQVPGSLIASNKAAVTEAQFNLAATPEYAAPQDALGAPGQTPEPPYKDVTAGTASQENIVWWNNVAADSLSALEDIFCACFPEFCRSYEIFDLSGIIPGLKVPSVNICGRSFDVCRYYPEMCESLLGPLEGLLDNLNDLTDVNVTIPGLPDILDDIGI